MRLVLKRAFFLALFLTSFPIWALQELPFDLQLKETIHQTFFEGAGLSDSKILKFEEQIQQRRHEIVTLISRNHLLRERKKPEKLEEELAKEELIQLYDLILSDLQLMRTSNDLNDAQLIAQRILEMEYSTLVEGVRPIIEIGLNYIPNILKRWKIKKNTPDNSEASNLYDQASGLYFTPKELDQLKAAGTDISMLNPSSKTSFWTKRNINQVNVDKVAAGKIRLYEGIEIQFPNAVAVYKKIRKTQTKPKIDVETEINGKKRTFKIKVGAEVHSEITSGLLMATLGYNIDMTRYARDFKMIIPKKIKFRDIKKEWNSYFQNYDIDKYIKEQGKTDSGEDYVIFTEVIMETKPDEILRAGPWAWGKLGKRGLREARGMLLFNMWVGNTDIKESENNKMVMKPKDDGTYEIFHMQHDMGFSFGRWLPEKPGEFPWDIISKSTSGEIGINYRSFQTNSGFDHVTYADMKWMARQIAQLTRSQISRSIELAGWPESLQSLLVEKLINRRNQLVNAFEMSDEYPIMPCDRTLTTNDNAIQNGRLTQSHFEGHTQTYHNETLNLLKPVYEGLEMLAVQALQGVAASFDRKTFVASDFGIEKDIISEVEVTFGREILPNTRQTGDDDKFIVEDTMNIRFGFGYGIILRGKANYVKTYKLAYPVKDRQSGMYNNNFIVNVLLPYHARIGKLPKNYILIMEDAIEAEGIVEFAPQNTYLGTSLSALVGKLSRTVVSFKENKYKIFKDKSLYRELNHRIFAHFWILRIPIWKWTNNKGHLHRDVYEINPSKGDANSKLAAIDQFLRSNDENFLEEVAERSDLSTQYHLNRMRLNFLSLFKFRSLRRIDHIRENEFDNGAIEETRNLLQISHLGLSQWAIVGNDHTKELKLTAKIQDNGEIKNPTVQINLLLVDRDTKSKELSNSYIPMLNRLSNDNKFIDFSPSLHSTNDRWGETHMYANLVYGEEAIDKIINFTENDLWNSLSQVSGVSVKDLQYRQIGTVRSHGQRQSNPLGQRLRMIIAKLKKTRLQTGKAQLISFMDALNKAVWKGEGSFNPYILATFNRLLNKKHFYLTGLIMQAQDKENKFPARTPLYNEIGETRELKYSYKEFDFNDVRMVWEVF
jgi:hypothetical protein